jgi:hypothetical protein
MIMKEKCKICKYTPSIISILISGIEICSTCAAMFIRNLEECYPKEHKEMLKATKKQIREYVK